MNEILPAIIAKDFDELQAKIKKVESLVSWVQIDIMDGVFVPPETWKNPKDLSKINTNLKMEGHFMTSDIEEYLDDWLLSCMSRFLFHIESLDESIFKRVSEKVKEKNKELGLSLKMETDLSELDFFIKDLDVVQLMSIDKIGYYGESFDARVIPKIISLREKYPDVKIEVDGGVNFESAKKLLDIGVDRLAIGSAIFKSKNIEKTIKLFQNL